MSQAIRIVTLSIAAMLLLAAPTHAAGGFGVEDFRVDFSGPQGEAVTQAGSHPFQVSTKVVFDSTPTGEGGRKLAGAAHDIWTAQMPGLIGSQTAVPTCSGSEFLTISGGNASLPDCPDSSAVGTVAVNLAGPTDTGTSYAPVFNLEPSPGIAAKIGFVVLHAPVVLEFSIAESSPYDIVGGSTNTTQVVEVASATLTLWGVPAAHAHDGLRGACLSPVTGESNGQSCLPGSSAVPFLTMPRACGGPLRTSYAIDSWADRGAKLANKQPDLADPAWLQGFDETRGEGGLPAGFGGCERLGFAPEISARPTSRATESSSGLDFSLDARNPGLENADGFANADIAKAVVTLPEGMTANPSSANGLETCSESQLAAETPWAAPGEGPTYTAPGAGCPDASKLGSIEVQTPLLDETLEGSLYLATPYANPEHTLLALYMVIKSTARGVIFKLPLRVEPDPQTGQLVTVSEDIPQWPFSHFRLHFREGARSPLVTPPSCGTHTVRALLYPSTGGAPAQSSSSFEIVSGSNGGPCPSGAQPFDPGFEAGSINNAAGRYSEFDMRLTRADGDQDLTRFSAKLPPGVLGRIAGTSQCSDAAIAQARSRTGEHGGEEERNNPSCPADSQIGTVEAGAGVGSILTYVPGRLYLAGPYNGAPLSVVAIVPGLAGPFDVGTVVTQEALRIDPVSAQVEADGSSSDPIPHILKGIPLKVRDIRVHVDRPDFTLNPTSCVESETQATLWAGGQNVFSSLDDTPHSLAARFQAADCASLAFKPKLAIKLFGGTKRGAFPALRAIVAPPPGQANFARAAVTLPRSAFLEQGHIRTICTRVQFAAGAGHGSQCPKASIYGHAKAWTPLLDAPASGPVYLRSSSHKLPDLVVALKGPASAPIDVELSSRIDSVKGGIRSIFTGIPDVPVSRFVLAMQGGQKGLIVNSRNLCFKPKRNRAKAVLLGQNGRRSKTRPVVRAVKCGKARKKSHKRHHRRHRG